MINPFRKRAYAIRHDEDSVYVEWKRPIEEWTNEEQDEYLPMLRKHILATLSDAEKGIVDKVNPSQCEQYCDYVNSVRNELISEYGLQGNEEAVRIGKYHAGLLVISFPAEDGRTYPYYFRGVQLKPHAPTHNQAMHVNSSSRSAASGMT